MSALTRVQRAALRDLANLGECPTNPTVILSLLDALDQAEAEVERLRVEATSGPSWDAVALRSALVAMTVERDNALAEIERLRRMLHDDEAHDDAIDAIARVRALCGDWENNVEPYEQGTYYVAELRILAALDKEA